MDATNTQPLLSVRDLSVAAGDAVAFGQTICVVSPDGARPDGDG